MDNKKIKASILDTAMRGNPILAPKPWRWHAWNFLRHMPEESLHKAMCRALLDVGSWSIPEDIANAAQIYNHVFPDAPKLIGSNRALAQDNGGRLHLFITEAAQHFFSESQNGPDEPMRNAWKAMYEDGYTYSAEEEDIPVKAAMNGPLSILMNAGIELDSYCGIVIRFDEQGQFGHFEPRFRELLGDDPREIEPGLLAWERTLKNILDIYMQFQNCKTAQAALTYVLGWRKYCEYYPEKEPEAKE